MEINFDVCCPHCAAPLPKTIDNIEIKSTNQLIGAVCPACAFVISKDDVAIIDEVITKERETFENNIVDQLFQDDTFIGKKS